MYQIKRILHVLWPYGLLNLITTARNTKVRNPGLIKLFLRLKEAGGDVAHAETRSAKPSAEEGAKSLIHQRHK